MELDKIIGKFDGKFDKWMHEHGYKIMFVLTALVALIFFLLWVLATSRMPEGNVSPSAAARAADLL